MSNLAEKAFQARCEIVAQRLEAKAQFVRRMSIEEFSAIERASEIVAECDGVGAHSLKVLIKRAVLADEESEK